MGCTDSLNGNWKTFAYEWAITMRKRQKLYHALHGNGLDSQPMMAPSTTVERLPESLYNYKLAKQSGNDDWVMYTDGSFKNGEGGWAVVAELLRPFGGIVPKPAEAHIKSSTVPELAAVDEACRHLDQRSRIGTSIISSTHPQP